MKALSVLCLAIFASIAVADEPKTREQLERQESYDAAREALDEVDRLGETMDRKRKSACMMAFGHLAFCECLNEHVGFAVTFDLYVLAVTRSDQELNYTSLSELDRGLVDSARQTREKCVKVL